MSCFITLNIVNNSGVVLGIAAREDYAHVKSLWGQTKDWDTLSVTQPDGRPTTVRAGNILMIVPAEGDIAHPTPVARPARRRMRWFDLLTPWSN